MVEILKTFKCPPTTDYSYASMKVVYSSIIDKLVSSNGLGDAASKRLVQSKDTVITKLAYLTCNDHQVVSVMVDGKSSLVLPKLEILNVTDTALEELSLHLLLLKQKKLLSNPNVQEIEQVNPDVYSRWAVLKVCK